MGKGDSTISSREAMRDGAGVANISVPGFAPRLGCLEGGPNRHMVARWPGNDVTKILRILDPGVNCILRLGNCPLGRFGIAHAAGKIGNDRSETAPIRSRSRLDQNWVFQIAHVAPDREHILSSLNVK